MTDDMFRIKFYSECELSISEVNLELATELICLEGESRTEPDSEALTALIEKIEATLK